MEQKYYWVISIIAILGVLAISGCAKQQAALNLSTEENITIQCINELNVFEDKFGISRENITILSSNCSTCSPWYSPQVAVFDAVIEKDGKKYNLSFSTNCPRHEQSVIKYTITSDENTESYSQMKKNICTDFNKWAIYLNECWKEGTNPPSIDEFTSCVNNNTKFIENNITDIGKDWEYCSAEGWKRCQEWNSCEPSGPSQTSVCTPEYCKMSCLTVYSEKKIREKFTEICENWDKKEDGKYVFSFEVPGDIEKIISTNFLKLH